jgi:hypothetical protein
MFARIDADLNATRFAPAIMRMQASFNSLSRAVLFDLASRCQFTPNAPRIDSVADPSEAATTAQAVSDPVIESI